MSDDTPRLLTPEEIEDILGVFNEPWVNDYSKARSLKAAAKEVAVVAFENLKSRLRAQMSGHVLTPKAIPDLKKLLVFRYNRAHIHPGTTVGITSAEALAAPITQGALNAFHQSGSSKNVASAIDQFNALLNMSDHIAFASCNIHYKDRHLSIEEVLASRAELVALTMKEIIQDYTVSTPSVQPQDVWWYRLHGRVPENPRWMMRVILNPGVMFNYKITMRDVVDKLQQDNTMVVVSSPLAIGILYIYVDERYIERFTLKLNQRQINTNTIALLFMDTVVIPSFDKITFKGVVGIRRLFPTQTPVWSVVERETPTYPRSSSVPLSRTWTVALHQGRSATSGITAANVARLCVEAGIEVLREDNSFLVVRTPPSVEPATRPGAHIQKLVKVEQEKAKAQGVVPGKIVARYSSKLLNASVYVYAETNGSNLAGVIYNDSVDPYHTTSNEILEFYKLFGIEAGRNLFLDQFRRILDSEGYSMDERHITLVADFMFNQGRPNAITAKGISRQRASFLSQITVGQVFPTIERAAFMGRKDPVQSTSATIMLGKRSLIGTGSFDVILNEAELKALEEKIARQETLAAVDIAEAMDNIERDVFGVGNVAADNLEADIFGEAPSVEPPRPVVVPKTIASKTPGRDPPQVKPTPLVSSELASIAKSVKINALPERHDVVVVEEIPPSKAPASEQIKQTPSKKGIKVTTKVSPAVVEQVTYADELGDDSEAPKVAQKTPKGKSPGGLLGKLTKGTVAPISAKAFANKLAGK